MDTETDVYAQFDPPKALPYVGTLVGLLVFVGTSHFYDNSAPFFAALSVGVITILIGLTWPLRRRRLLWALVIAIAAVHVAILIFIRLPIKVSYGAIFAPVMALEVYALYRLIIAALRMEERAQVG